MDDRGGNFSRGTLYRDPDNGKICGVCAGIAEHFGFETWVVRMIAVSLAIFLNGGAVVAYFVACWVLDVKPGTQGSKKRKGHSQKYQSSAEDDNSKKKNRRYKPNVQEVWKRGTSASNTIQRLNKRYSKMEDKLRPMESFVTSDKFALHKEFESIQDGPVVRD